MCQPLPELGVLEGPCRNKWIPERQSSMRAAQRSSSRSPSNTRHTERPSVCAVSAEELNTLQNNSARTFEFVIPFAQTTTLNKSFKVTPQQIALWPYLFLHLDWEWTIWVDTWHFSPSFEWTDTIQKKRSWALSMSWSLIQRSVAVSPGCGDCITPLPNTINISTQLYPLTGILTISTNPCTLGPRFPRDQNSSCHGTGSSPVLSKLKSTCLALRRQEVSRKNLVYK
jgi:hypothetical protein